MGGGNSKLSAVCCLSSEGDSCAWVRRSCGESHGHCFLSRFLKMKLHLKSAYNGEGRAG